MPEEDKEKGNIKEKWIWFKKLNSVFERMYVGGKSGWVGRGVHEGLMGQCHCDPLRNLNGSLVPISLHLIFLTQLCVPESTSAFFFFLSIFFSFSQEGHQTCRLPKQAIILDDVLDDNPQFSPSPSSSSSGPKDTINHLLLWLKLTCWWTSSFSEAYLNIKEQPHIHAPIHFVPNLLKKQTKKNVFWKHVSKFYLGKNIKNNNKVTEI